MKPFVTIEEIIRDRIRNKNPYHSVYGDDFLDDLSDIPPIATQKLPHKVKHQPLIVGVRKKIYKKLCILINSDWIKSIVINVIAQIIGAMFTCCFGFNKPK